MASGGTLDALIPPSILFVLYGVFAEVSVAKLLIAGIIPGLLTAAVYTVMIVVRCWLNPTLAPPVEFPDRAALWRERWDSLERNLADLVLVIGVIGGLYAGVVTPTEGGAVGALLATLIGVLQRQLSWPGSSTRCKDAIGTTAQLFFVGIGAVLFTKFLALAGTADMFTELIGALGAQPAAARDRGVDHLLILGMFLDPLGMILLTIPVFVPMFAALKPRSGLVRRDRGQIYRHRAAHPAGRLQHLRRRQRDRQHDPAADHLPRLLLVSRLRGRDHDAADRVPADLAVPAGADEVMSRQAF